MASRNPTRGASNSKRPWSLEDLQELMDVLEKRQIAEFELETGAYRIRIRRSIPVGPATATEPASLAPESFPEPASSDSSPAPIAVPSTTAAEPASAESAEGLYIIKSPIVGTFYASPAPNAPPFVKVGDVVEPGKVLCIIEAMKLMNDIEAEVGGEVVRIYVENGQPVEYGQSLFAIKPSHKK